MPQDIECHKSAQNALGTCAKALIALGGNVASAAGDPEATLRAALLRLADSELTVEKTSRFYETPCFPIGSGPDYINSAAVVSGADNPHAILKVLHRIEAEFGRARDRRWGRRTLDLDILAMGELTIPDENTFLTWRHLPLDQQMLRAPAHLILPHPRMQDRAFVLIPLAEIAPGWRHPVSGQTVVEMRDALPDDEKSQVKPL